MRRLATALATLTACAVSWSAHAIGGGTPTLTTKPTMTGEQVLQLAPHRRDALLAKTVRDGSFVSRGACALRQARLLGRTADGAMAWRVDCADAEAQVVVMPLKAREPATVLSCRRSKALLGVECGSMRRADR